MWYGTSRMQWVSVVNQRLHISKEGMLHQSAVSMNLYQFGFFVTDDLTFGRVCDNYCCVSRQLHLSYTLQPGICLIKMNKV